MFHSTVALFWGLWVLALLLRAERALAQRDVFFCGKGGSKFFTDSVMLGTDSGNGIWTASKAWTNQSLSQDDTLVLWGSSIPSLIRSGFIEKSRIAKFNGVLRRERRCGPITVEVSDGD